MLILTRKVGEIVHIGADAKVEFVGMRMGKVRLGFTAPPELGIWRGELLEALPDDIRPRSLLEENKALRAEVDRLKRKAGES
jgi:carbon storage regulator CsrA